MRRVPANVFLCESKNALVLDVRSPAEYNHAHIPGAVSLPLFSDEERKVVGTAYKQVSRQAAIKIGLDYFGPKMRKMVEEVETICDLRFRISDLVAADQSEIQNSKSEIFLYCWRGGMRSGAVAWLLNLYGFNVSVLAGGYKAFRNYVLQSFEQFYPFKIIGGYTGSGKTELLQQLKTAGENVVDLEDLATHKGSAFGNLDMAPQPSQEMFENNLSRVLLALNREQSPVQAKTLGCEDTTVNFKLETPNFIWLEDESQRIGAVNIPYALWQTLRNAPVYFLDVPFEERLKHIVAQYGHCEKQKLLDAIERIKKRLGGLEAKLAAQFLNEGNIEDCFRILLRYYDKHYLKALHQRQNLPSLLTTIPCQKVSTQNATALLKAPLTA